MPASGMIDPHVRPVQYQGPGFAPPPTVAPSPGPLPENVVPVPVLPGDPDVPIGPDLAPELPGTPVPWDIYVTEARTGQFMLGVGVNSDAGVTGQIILDERNFNIARWPTSLDEVFNGTAFRGAGQGFRVEAIPGNRVERYMVNFVEPYLFDTQISFSVSGFLYSRRFFDWDEERLGGRVALGYRLTADMSVSAALRAEKVTVFDPRVTGVPELDDVLGDNSLFSPRFTLTHDTRDSPFSPTEGHYIEMSYEQVFGSFDYPRGEVDFRKYFLITQRPDTSGRHTLAYSFQLGFSGAQTPVFENFFAGGYSTLRGFDFRGASPVNGGVIVGGEFRFLGAVEYFFPLTADDMIKGVLFCDFGTVEEKIDINAEDYRVAPAVPALGPAPIALDLAVPVAREDTDDIQNFSFFFGFGRS
jgi:outer membrane protein insertion porin family